MSAADRRSKSQEKSYLSICGAGLWISLYVDMMSLKAFYSQKKKIRSETILNSVFII